MVAVYIQKPLAPEELSRLKDQFPDYDFLIQEPESLEDIEVLYGDQLNADQLNAARHLRWIHVPQASLHGLPLKQIEETKNLLITNTKDPDVHCFAEYAFAAILSSAKKLLGAWEHEALWSLQKRTLLQIGLGPTGTAICEKAKQFGMRTWGIVHDSSFHAHCDKTFDPRELHSLLPAVDILSISLPRGTTPPILLGEDELKLLDDETIIAIIGSETAIDHQALAHQSERFRSVVWDTSQEPQSKNIVYTPNIAAEPTRERRVEFHQFQYNFRRYARNEFDGMKNLIQTTQR